MKKVLCSLILPLILSNTGYAMYCPSLNYDLNSFNKSLFSGGYYADVIYKSDKYPRIIKKNFQGCFGNKYEAKTAEKLIGVNHKNLMKCIQIPDNKHILYEFIEGNTLENWMYKDDRKLDLDFFLKNWCIGLFSGMEEFRNAVGEYKGDMKQRNIMVNNDLIPVLIDYGDTEGYGVLKKLSSILSYVMEKKVEKTKQNEEKWNALYSYLKGQEGYDFGNIFELQKIDDCEHNLGWIIENKPESLTVDDILQIAWHFSKELILDSKKLRIRNLDFDAVFYVNKTPEMRYVYSSGKVADISDVSKFIIKIIKLVKNPQITGDKEKIKKIKQFIDYIKEEIRDRKKFEKEKNDRKNKIMEEIKEEEASISITKKIEKNRIFNDDVSADVNINDNIHNQKEIFVLPHYNFTKIVNFIESIK